MQFVLTIRRDIFRKRSSVNGAQKSALILLKQSESEEEIKTSLIISLFQLYQALIIRNCGLIKFKSIA